MRKKRIPQSVHKCSKNYISSDTCELIFKTKKTEPISTKEYEADIEEIRKALRTIEETYYSSNVKLERIRKKKTLDILRITLFAFLRTKSQYK